MRALIYNSIFFVLFLLLCAAVGADVWSEQTRLLEKHPECIKRIYGGRQGFFVEWDCSGSPQWAAYTKAKALLPSERGALTPEERGAVERAIAWGEALIAECEAEDKARSEKEQAAQRAAQMEQLLTAFPPNSNTVEKKP